LSTIFVLVDTSSVVFVDAFGFFPSLFFSCFITLVIVLDSLIYERRAYKKCVEEGKTLDEFAHGNDDKAAKDFEVFFKEIVKIGNQN